MSGTYIAHASVCLRARSALPRCIVVPRYRADIACVGSRLARWRRIRSQRTISTLPSLSSLHAVPQVQSDAAHDASEVARAWEDLGFAYKYMEQFLAAAASYGNAELVAARADQPSLALRASFKRSAPRAPLRPGPVCVLGHDHHDKLIRSVTVAVTMLVTQDPDPP
eukprot:1346620-Rhodomonas_salina.1